MVIFTSPDDTDSTSRYCISIHIIMNVNLVKTHKYLRTRTSIKTLIASDWNLIMLISISF